MNSPKSNDQSAESFSSLSLRETLLTNLSSLGYETMTLLSPVTQRGISFDMPTLTMYFDGTAGSIPLITGTVYYLGVYEPNNFAGTYRINLGTTSNNAQYVQDTSPDIDPDSIIFDDSDTRGKLYEGPTAFEQKLFPSQKTPFQTFDSKLKLFSAQFSFWTYRLQELFR